MEINSTYKRPASDRIHILNCALFKWSHILDELKLPFYINQSCALGILREGHFFENERVIELAVLDEDLTDEKRTALMTEKEIAGEKVDFHKENSHEAKSGLFYFHDLELQPVLFKNHKAYYNLIDASCIWFPEEYCLKENWGKIKYLDQEWNVPGNLPAFLQCTYGDWKIPRSFSWPTEALNVTEYSKL